MVDSLLQVFDTSGFPPRWDCGTTWRQEPGWGWLHISADIAVWTAYTAIPLVLLYVVRSRRDIPFPRIFWLFGAFIFACGTTHLLDAASFWWPAYRLSALVRLVTAAASWSTVFALLPVARAALALRGPEQLEQEIQSRTRELQDLTVRLKREIEERQRVEHALREREERLQTIIECGQMGTWEWDLTSNALQMDERERELFGFEPHESATRADDAFSRVSPEDVSGVREKVKESIAGEITYQHEFRVVHPGGAVRWLAGRGDVIRDEHGRAIRMTGVNFDVTDRHAAEEDLRLRDRALESATNGIVIADALEPDCPIIYANHGFEELTGYPRDEVLGRNCRFLQGPETDPDTVAAIRRALAGQSECHVTIRNYRKDGRPFWNEVRITPIFDDHGQVTHYVGVQADADARMAFEQSLKDAEARASAANQAKSEFLANMSHEIRTPLTAVLGCADTLYPRLSVDEHRDMVQMIRNQGRLLLGILNDILDLSKIEAGKLEIHRDTCSIVSILEDVRSLLEPQASDRNLALTTEYRTDMPEVMRTDPLRVRQVLVNLVGNAIKFTEEGSVEIIAGCDVRDPEPHLTIEVRDTGVGIPPDRLEAIFEAFTQEHRELSRKLGGTGLGLTISQKLVEMLDGRIDVTSEVGTGTVFRVTLPLGLPDEPRLASARALAHAADAQQKSHDSIDMLLPARILVAEDTRGIQFMIRRMLEDAGATVAVVDNGVRAIEEAQAAERSGAPFDLILMDMQMPVLNGFDATARLRSGGCLTPIVALTAAAMHGDRERCLAAGCDDYLPKPIDRHMLLNVLSRQYNRTAGPE
jgi:PAS domain S-box-containing protein